MENASPLQPILLNPTALNENFTEPVSKRKKWVRTFLTMMAGWFIGNLVLGAIIGFFVISTIASTGLVKVPFLTQAMFKKPSKIEIDQKALASAEKKANEVNRLAAGQTIPELSFTEDEVNAYLANALEKTEASITNTSLHISNGSFILSGNLRDTNAPVLVEGSVDTSGGTLKLNFEKTVFGKMNLPAQLTSSILDNALATAGFSLDNTQIPARKLSIVDGEVNLEDVSKTP